MSYALFRLVVALWIVFEIGLAVHNSFARRGAVVRDRGSKLLIALAIALGFSLAFRSRVVAGAAIGLPSGWLTAIAMLFFLPGLIIRAHSVIMLGRFFTTTVTVRPGQRLIQSGLYARIRHPGYLGSLLIFVGLAVSFRNWLSAALLLLPIVPAFLNRIRVEERGLTEAFGEEYAEYSKTTKRLLPGLY